MIERILRSLEASRTAEAIQAVDAKGEPSWRRNAEELLRAVGGWQAELRGRGVGAGDRVALELPRGPELLPAQLAVLAVGAVLVPFNPALAPAERARVLERAEVRTRLGADDRPARARAPELRARPPSEPALLLFTSGTTGEPKGVPLSLAQLEANLAALEQAWGMSAADRLLHVLPCHHLHGLVLALWGSARLGIPIVLAERFDADVCIETLASQRATLFMGVPTMFRRMAHAQRARPLPAMRLYVSGSAPLTPADFHAFEARFGAQPLERYGLSETMIVASNPLEGDRRPGTVGQPLPRTELRLADDGEIEVRGPAVMTGYWQAPQLSADAFRDGFFRTGDLGHHDEAGYLCIHGRKKEVIIVGGSNVLPGEVEQGLAGEPGVEELAAAGLPDPDRGEIVAAFVVAAPGQDAAVLEARLRARAEQALAAYKRPKLYRFLAALPRNAMGKLDRRALRD